MRAYTEQNPALKLYNKETKRLKRKLSGRGDVFVLGPISLQSRAPFSLMFSGHVHIKIIFRQSFHLRVERRRIVVVMRCPLILHLSRDSGHSGLQRQWDTWENINKAKGSILLPCPQPPNPEVRICKDTVLE